MTKNECDLAVWKTGYGLWPGNALAVFAAHSRWVHLSTNTLPFYYTIPRLQGTFGTNISTWADDFESPLNHWLHEGPDDEHTWFLS